MSNVNIGDFYPLQLIRSLQAKFRYPQLLALLAMLLLAESAQAVTVLQFGLNRPDAIITEGYAGDLDVLTAEMNSGNVQTQLTPLPPVEERSYFPSSKPRALIVSVDSTVFDDPDRDGFYTQFGLRLDADVFEGGFHDIRVAIQIWLRRPGEDYLFFHTSESFNIYGGLNSDIYRFETELLSNYPADFYDIRLELIDTFNDVILDIVDANSTRALSALPLESRDLVEVPGQGIQSAGNRPADNGNFLTQNEPADTLIAGSASRDAIVREHAGSTSVLIPLFALLLLIRLKSNYRLSRKHT